MLPMTPLSIVAESEYSPSLHRYRVKFIREGQEVEYTFTVTDQGIAGVRPDDQEFSGATLQDPLMPKLMQAILYFHEARRY